IKTIGDAYMVVGGLTPGDPDHTARVAAMALRLADVTSAIRVAGRAIAFRIGIHRGPAVAGVIGAKKFIYDVWGDTVNTASRMGPGSVPAGPPAPPGIAFLSTEFLLGVIVGATVLFIAFGVFGIRGPGLIPQTVEPTTRPTFNAPRVTPVPPTPQPTPSPTPSPTPVPTPTPTLTPTSSPSQTPEPTFPPASLLPPSGSLTGTWAVVGGSSA